MKNRRKKLTLDTLKPTADRIIVIKQKNKKNEKSILVHTEPDLYVTNSYTVNEC